MLLRPAELRVLRLLAQGLTELEVSRELHYSYAHTRKLAASAAERLGAKNVKNAIYRAAKRGLI